MRYQQKSVDKQMGERLAKCRKELGISQEQMAETLGISQRALSSYETGIRSIPVFLVPRISALLGISLEEFLGTESQQFDGRTKPARLLKKLECVQQFSQEDQKVVFAVIDSLTEKYLARQTG